MGPECLEPDPIHTLHHGSQFLNDLLLSLLVDGLDGLNAQLPVVD